MNEEYIRQTFKLARKAGSRAYPDPLVGAVIVKGGKIIGEGYHRAFGGDHAEVDALKKCKVSAKGAAIYVNLEPCCHFGKNPPCTGEIIKAGIKKVVFCNYDPSPKTKKLRNRQLEKNGIEVIGKVLKKDGEKLNEIYFHYIKTGMPFTAIKIATSLDGKIATYTGSSKWVTNEKARSCARRLRGEYQAILVGANTVKKDNPHLGCRTRGLKDPIRIILGRVPAEKKYKVFRDDNFILIAKEDIPNLRPAASSRQVKLKALFKKLAEQGIISILAEGGASAISSILDQNMAQKIYWFQAPKIIGGTNSILAIQTKDIKNISQAIKLKNITYEYFGENLLLTGILPNNTDLLRESFRQK